MVSSVMRAHDRARSIAESIDLAQPTSWELGEAFGSWRGVLCTSRLPRPHGAGDTLAGTGS